MMLLPPLDDDHVGLRMIVRPTEPHLRYCYGGQIAMAPALPGNSLKVRAQVSLVPAGIDTDGDETPTESPIVVSDPAEFRFKLTSELTVPSPVYYALESEIERITGMTRMEFVRSERCAQFIDQLPSIKVSIIGSEETNDQLVHIYVKPSDYIALENGPRRKCRLDVSGIENPNYSSLGRPFLNQVGLLVDYSQRLFGFCEPL